MLPTRFALARADFLTALALSLVAVLAYLPFLGSVPLLDWDELIYAEAAREMVESGNFLQVYVNYQPFWEKPPLYFWLQSVSFRWFGVSEGAARLPNVIFFGLTVGLVFLVGRQLKGRFFGLGWAALFGTAILPVFYSKYGIIDPIFNFFIILALLGLFIWDQT
ncbi:glycosyltransferase family 39 protein, partial [Candidatus Cyanaurora vandensis]|uniref:ArnT family glycosyltransferase n=1 Tax=Candidatus Cyanaurora vandensis TaxID=2714958 RepID=UPI00257ABEF0